jgi:hypothetical protein
MRIYLLRWIIFIPPEKLRTYDGEHYADIFIYNTKRKKSLVRRVK